MDILEQMKARHSVRQYEDRPIEAEKRDALDAMAAQMNGNEGLRIQIVYDEPKCFDSFMAHYGKFSGVSNYIALVGKKAPGLDEKLGFCGEKLVLKAQELGLNTCWVALTHGKSSAKIGKREKLVCLIALGYGKNQGVSHTSKPMDTLCKALEPQPEWFARGMEAAMEAPTAMNQQKFLLELLPDGKVKATCGKGFYTELDLGIVKCHFAMAAGTENFCWA